MRILSGDSMSTLTNTSTTSSNNLNSTAADDNDIKKFWPCAPDGFIPNSIIRYLICPKREELDKVQPWQPRDFNFLDDEPEIEFCTPEFSDEGKLIIVVLEETVIMFCFKSKKKYSGLSLSRFRKGSRKNSDI